MGTELVTSRDAPALGGIYKLVQIDRDGETWYTAKFSQSKVTYPGKKQVFRFSDVNAFWTHDVIGLADEIVDVHPKLQSGYAYYGSQVARAPYVRTRPGGPMLHRTGNQLRAPLALEGDPGSLSELQKITVFENSACLIELEIYMNQHNAL